MPKSHAHVRPRGQRGWLTVVRPLVAASMLALLAVVACSDPGPALEAPTISSLTANPEQIQPGGRSTLAWSVSGAASLTLFPDGVDVTDRVSWTVEPSVSTTYRLVAANAAGEREASKTIIVGDLPDIVSFEAITEPGRELVNPGVPVTLAWSVTGAESVTIAGPGLPERTVGFDDTMVVTPPTAGARYTVRARNSAGPVEASVVVSRAVPAFSLLIAGQSNAKGVNIRFETIEDANAFITALAGVEMLGNDYVWKRAHEPTGDCVDHVDLVNADPAGGCTTFSQNTAGVSPGVSFGNNVRAATLGEVFLIQAAKDGSCLACTSKPEGNWQPLDDRPFDTATLFGSAANRARMAELERDAPLRSQAAEQRFGAVLWYQGTTETNSTSVANAYFSNTDPVLQGFETVLGAPIILVQLSSRGVDDPGGTDRNLLYQRVREVQRRMEDGARTVIGTSTSQARPGRYLVVTHDLPMHDVRHLSAPAQVELGRRVSLAVREHLLREPIDGTGPRLDKVEKVSSTLVLVRFDRPVSEPETPGPSAYSGYFAAFADGAQLTIRDIQRDSTDWSVVRIELQDSVPTGVSVEVRYMPPLASVNTGRTLEVRQDVIRSETCSDPIPGTNLCLPLPAFGTAISAETARALQRVVFDDED